MCAPLTPFADTTYYNAVDTLSLCGTGFYSVSGSVGCEPCGLGRANPFVGQTECACCAVGTFANVSGLSQCFDCSETSSKCNQRCTSSPICSCEGNSNCDIHRCSAGCTFQKDTCSQAPAGSYTRCGSPSNCSASANVVEQCPRRFFSPAVGASSNSTCTACPAGSYCPSQGMIAPVPCKPGYFSQASAVACELCGAGTYSAADGSRCIGCIAGTFCPQGSSPPSHLRARLVSVSARAAQDRLSPS